MSEAVDRFLRLFLLPLFWARGCVSAEDSEAGREATHRVILGSLQKVVLDAFLGKWRSNVASLEPLHETEGQRGHHEDRRSAGQAGAPGCRQERTRSAQE